MISTSARACLRRIADPDADRVEVYRLRDGAYGKPEIAEPGETLTTDLLPGLSIDIASLFART